MKDKEAPAQVKARVGEQWAAGHAGPHERALLSFQRELCSIPAVQGRHSQHTELSSLHSCISYIFSEQRKQVAKLNASIN